MGTRLEVAALHLRRSRGCRNTRWADWSERLQRLRLVGWDPAAPWTGADQELWLLPLQARALAEAAEKGIGADPSRSSRSYVDSWCATTAKPRPQPRSRAEGCRPAKDEDDTVGGAGAGQHPDLPSQHGTGRVREHTQRGPAWPWRPLAERILARTERSHRDRARWGHRGEGQQHGQSPSQEKRLLGIWRSGRNLGTPEVDLGAGDNPWPSDGRSAPHSFTTSLGKGLCRDPRKRPRPPKEAADRRAKRCPRLVRHVQRPPLDRLESQLQQLRSESESEKPQVDPLRTDRNGSRLPWPSRA